MVSSRGRMGGNSAGVMVPNEKPINHMTKTKNSKEPPDKPAVLFL
jgi:hypothetical protein